MGLNFNAVVFSNDEHLESFVLLDVCNGFLMGDKRKVVIIALQDTVADFQASGRCRSDRLDLGYIHARLSEALRRLCVILIDTACNGEARTVSFDSGNWINFLLFRQRYRNLQEYFGYVLRY